MARIPGSPRSVQTIDQHYVLTVLILVVIESAARGNTIITSTNTTTITNANTTSFVYNGGCLSKCSDSLANENIIRVLSVEFKPQKPPPSINSITITTLTNTSVVFNVTLSDTGKVYCGIFYDTVAVSSTDVIRLQNHAASTSSYGGNSAVMTIGSLDPATNYNIICTTEGLNGMKLGLTDSINAKKGFTTVCCKTVLVSSLTSSISLLDDTGNLASGIANIISVDVDALPSSSLDVSVNVNLDVQSSSSSSSSTSAVISSSSSRHLFTTLATTLVPTKVSVARKGRLQTQYLSIPKTVVTAAAAIYNNDSIVANSDIIVYMTFSISLSGNSSEYMVSFPKGQSIVLLSPRKDPSAPVPTSVYFTNDGLGLLVNFDSNTDQGAIKETFFNCDKLLSFPSITGTSCSWSSSSLLTVRLGSSAAVNINDKVTILGNKIKPKCTMLPYKCQNYNSTVEASLLVSQPIVPLRPLIKILTSPLINNCDDLSMDLSASRGSGGRDWTNVTFLTIDNNGSKPLDVASAILTSSYDSSKPSVLKSGTSLTTNITNTTSIDNNTNNTNTTNTKRSSKRGQLHYQGDHVQLLRLVFQRVC